jgi:hypothetical protein
MTPIDIAVYGTLLVAACYAIIGTIMGARRRAVITKALHDRLDELENTVANLETELRSRKN